MEAFPAHRRAAGLSVIYSLGVVLFGGFSPFLVTWLINRTDDSMIPAWYLMGATALTLIALKAFPEAEPEAGARAASASQPAA
jgi:MHS family proline/betaine transporter-like MFS transporter